eukprot:gene28262-14681_t
MVRTARSAPLFRRRRLPTPQAPPKQTVSPHLPIVLFLVGLVHVEGGKVAIADRACDVTDVFKGGDIYAQARIPPDCLILDLHNVNLGPTSATALAVQIRDNTGVTELVLSKNTIGNKGAIAIAEALKKNSAIQFVKLEKNMIGDAGVQALAAALEVNSVLTDIELRWNDIESRGAVALAQALKSNRGLMVLDLRGNKAIGKEAAEAFAE